MIDLEAIKAEGLNSDAHSAQLLAIHQARDSMQLHSDLCAKFLRDNPTVSAAEFECYVWRAASEVRA